MQVPFLALDRDYRAVEDDVRARFERVLESQVFVLGEETRALEHAIESVAGARYAVACSSGTEALSLALLALGIGRGDAVMVPTFTFVATAGAVHHAGAVPIFADIDAATFNSGADEIHTAIDRWCERTPDGLRHRGSGARVRALVAVHLFGRAASMAAIGEVASEHGLRIIEDGAQAIGAVGDRGPVGSWGAAGCFSFYPTKNLGGAGDGGAVTTGDEERAARLRRLRTHGAEAGAYVHDECGVNARIGELQAAYLNAKLSFLDDWTRARGRVAALYRERLGALAAAGAIELAADAEPPAHVFHQLVVRVGRDRDGVRRRMSARGVETRVFYPLPLHLQPCFAYSGHVEGDFPAAERAAREVLALPIHPWLGADGVDAVCRALAASVGE